MPDPSAGNGRMPADVLLLFTKRPDPGRAKTRLIPVLGEEGAAALHGRLARHAADVARAVRTQPLRRVACVAPDSWCYRAAELLGDGLEAWPQGDGNLGDRLGRAFARAFEDGASRVVVYGSDCPDLGAKLIDDAFRALRTHDACFGPAADGGYYLLGLAWPIPSVFEGVPWSSDDTGRITLERLAAARAWVRHLPTLRDLDLPADLDALRTHHPDLLTPRTASRPDPS